MPETNRNAIQQRLEREGWFLERRGRKHDIYKHPVIQATISLPRHRVVHTGTARGIARTAGWS